MERNNVNRGFKQLIVWNDAIDLYVLSCKILLNFPFELKKTAGNCIDSVHSISRNIAEGYCRKGIKEYLNFLNIALASSGEFHSSLIIFVKANQISKEDFEKLDELHYKTENALIRLIKSLQIKLKDGSWETSFRE
jgi:four helix bundle protein